jgi:hypothetical protein
LLFFLLFLLFLRAAGRSATGWRPTSRTRQRRRPCALALLAGRVCALAAVEAGSATRMADEGDGAARGRDMREPVRLAAVGFQNRDFAPWQYVAFVDRLLLCAICCCYSLFVHLGLLCALAFLLLLLLLWAPACPGCCAPSSAGLLCTRAVSYFYNVLVFCRLCRGRLRPSRCWPALVNPCGADSHLQA